MTTQVVLIGLPAVGKTTVGRATATLLGVPFADSDDLITADAGQSIADLFLAEGEAGFRNREAEVIMDALSSFDGVLALGGGAVTTAAVRDALIAMSMPVVLLQADLETLLERVGDTDHRPLLAGDPAGRLDALAAERAKHYSAVATLTIDTTDRVADEIAADIVESLEP